MRDDKALRTDGTSTIWYAQVTSSSSSCIFTFIFKTGTYIACASCWVKMTLNFWLSCLCLPSIGTQACIINPHLWYWVLNPGPCAFKAGTLLPKPCPQALGCLPVGGTLGMGFMTTESLLENPSPGRWISSETVSPCPCCFSSLRLIITTLLKWHLWVGLPRVPSALPWGRIF